VLAGSAPNCFEQKDISPHQPLRILEIHYRSAWLLMHRARAAMRDGSLSHMVGSAGQQERKNAGHKNVVRTLFECGGSAPH
jgi:predicted methyltransferase